MVNLDVYFNHDDNFDGQAILDENLITGSCNLELKSTLYIGEIKAFINKASAILKKKRYNQVKVTIHWDSENPNDKSNIEIL